MLRKRAHYRQNVIKIDIKQITEIVASASCPQLKLCVRIFVHNRYFYGQKLNMAKQVWLLLHAS